MEAGCRQGQTRRGELQGSPSGDAQESGSSQLHHNRLKTAPPVATSDHNTGATAGDIQPRPRGSAAVNGDGGSDLAEASGRFAIRPAASAQRRAGVVPRSPDSVIIDIEGPGAALPLLADG